MRVGSCPLYFLWFLPFVLSVVLALVHLLVEQRYSTRQGRAHLSGTGSAGFMGLLIDVCKLSNGDGL